MKLQEMKCLAVLKREKWEDYIFKAIMISVFFSVPTTCFF